jgi:hypothetical protein
MLRQWRSGEAVHTLHWPLGLCSRYLIQALLNGTADRQSSGPALQRYCGGEALGSLLIRCYWVSGSRSLLHQLQRSRVQSGESAAYAGTQHQ